MGCTRCVLVGLEFVLVLSAAVLVIVIAMASLRSDSGLVPF